MATIVGPKYTGSTLIDLSNVKDGLIDLPPFALRGARAEKDGLGEVLAELAVAMPAAGEQVEIHPAVYQRVLDATDSIKKLREHEVVLEKALEVCRETRGMKENNREDDISAIATKADEKASKGKNAGLRALFEKTIAYKGVFGEKSAETRRKNEEAKEAAKHEPEVKAAPPASPMSPVL